MQLGMEFKTYAIYHKGNEAYYNVNPHGHTWKPYSFTAFDLEGALRVRKSLTNSGGKYVKDDFEIVRIKFKGRKKTINESRL